MFRFDFDGDGPAAPQLDAAADTSAAAAAAAAAAATAAQGGQSEEEEGRCTELAFSLEVATGEAEVKAGTRQYADGVQLALRQLGLERLNSSASASSDLVPRVYEGGLKLWECAEDLVNYLIQHAPHEWLAGKTTLEAGCGVGLPGIYCLTAGATVHFQDYNTEVLATATVPNVALNAERTACPRAAASRFFAGDWRRLVVEDGPMHGLSYELVLASETVYSQESMERLHDFLAAVVRKPGGIVLLATKTYYFGVGGGAREFEQLAARRGLFDTEVVHTVDDGVRREILRLAWKASTS